MYLPEIEKLLVQMSRQGVNISTILWGPTGIGKSAVVKRVAEILNYNLIDLRLSMRESVDILGMPYTGKIRVTVRNPKLGKTISEEVEADCLLHYPPEFFVKALYEGKCVLFLDELNRARPEVLQAVFQLALDRELNGQKLPDDVLIVSACNPPDKRYDTISFDDALTARFMHLRARTTADYWLDWAKGMVDGKDGKQRPRVHENVSAFIATQKDALMKDNELDNKLPMEIEPHPRSWEFVSRLESLDVEDKILSECVSGLVGTKLGQQYMVSRSSGDKPIKLEEIFGMTDDPHDPVRERVKRYTSTVSNKDSLHKIRLDLLKETCSDIERREVDCRQYRKQVTDFLEIIPKDLASKTIQAIYRKDLHSGEPENELWSAHIMGRKALADRLEEMVMAQKSIRSS